MLSNQIQQYLKGKLHQVQVEFILKTKPINIAHLVHSFIQQIFTEHLVYVWN